MRIYCTYLTIYLGNKLPPYYIGFSYLSKIEKGYRGSVVSKKYKQIWKEELYNNPHLFKTIILTTHKTKQEAKSKETYFQNFFNVHINPMYINMCINSEKFNAPWENKTYRKTISDTLKKTHKEQKIWTIERRKKQSEYMLLNSSKFWSPERKQNQSLSNKEKFDHQHYINMSLSASNNTEILQIRSNNMSSLNSRKEKCFICGFEGNPGNIARWHNKKCKERITSFDCS